MSITLHFFASSIGPHHVKHGDGLTEEDYVGFQRRKATLAYGVREHAGFGLSEIDLCRTSETDEPPVISVVFDNIAVTCCLMESVYVLGNYRLEKSLFLELTEGHMGGRRLCRKDHAGHFPQHVPYLLRVAAKRIYVSILHGIILFPESLPAAKGGNTTVDGYT